ncbi:unnamed protein product [Nippostrongylus brasiliensis]|uniref:UBX domain-containing protein 4 n=1 Tax=Nippostrongylus brasiliensis TaxID=27835 RepID=A0A0N4Y1I3_NIPBR|nr:unnamed protein product [Nippostrongylus brasiliensis]
MKWFAGTVSTAIQISRKNNALFVVFIESKNEKGEKMRQLWDKADPTPVLPASYFIDNLGKPIEVITLLKDLDYDEFFTKIMGSVQVVEAFQTFSAAVKGTSTQQPAQASTATEVPAASFSSVPTPSSSMSLEEKAQRARMLLEQKRKLEEEAKKEEEKRRELERIAAGKLMQEAQQKRHEQELIESAAQRRRDKIEAEKERERLKAQIKADREEREFRERRGKPVEASAASAPPNEAAPRMEPVPSDRCRVQVRLPNGDNIVEEFSSDDHLSTLFDLIVQDGRVKGAFSIAQVYPRKTFSEEEMQKSFLELCLTPTCTLLVIQSQTSSSQIITSNPFRGLFSLFTLLVVGPLQYVYNMVAGWLGWNSGINSPGTGSGQTRSEETKRRRDPHPTGGVIRRRGNTGRLHNTNDDSDDETANWNGNSTQFL